MATAPQPNRLMDIINSIGRGVPQAATGFVDLAALPFTMSGLLSPKQVVGSTEYLTAKGLLPPPSQSLLGQSVEAISGGLMPLSPAAMRATQAGIEATGKALAPKAYDMLENYMVKSGGMLPLTAYHGTPHNIQGGFDISKVGTGEGAQAYGHGMYFAENPNVAKEYADKLGYDYKYAGKAPKEGSPTDFAIRWLKNLEWNKEAAKAQWKNEGFGAKVIQAIDKVDLEKVKAPGNLYKVDIPDKDIPNMLDWDKPLAQQNKEVLESLKKLNDPYINKAISSQPKLSKDGEYWEYMGNTYGSKSEALEDATPHRIITGYTGLGETPADVSKTLNSVGIKGVSYLDQNSRIGGSGTKNFVVFDPTDVKILEKNNMPVEGLLD